MNGCRLLLTPDCAKSGFLRDFKQESASLRELAKLSSLASSCKNASAYLELINQRDLRTITG